MNPKMSKKPTYMLGQPSVSITMPLIFVEDDIKTTSQVEFKALLKKGSVSRLLLESVTFLPRDVDVEDFARELRDKIINI